MARVAEIARARPCAGAVAGIGDGPATDIRGRERQGMDGIFIGSGIHGHGMSARRRFRASAAQELAADGVARRYAMPDLTW